MLQDKWSHIHCLAVRNDCGFPICSNASFMHTLDTFHYFEVLKSCSSTRRVSQTSVHGHIERAIIVVIIIPQR